MATNDRRSGRRSPYSSPDASGFLDSFQRFWSKSFAGDYAGLIVMVVIYMVLKATDEPFHRMFRLDDPRIQFPHAEVERVPVSYLMLYGAVIPLAVIALWTTIVARDVQKAHVTLLGLIITLLMTTLLTDIFKDVVGRPRPDLIARCKPAPGTPTTSLVTVDVCTETRHHVLHDGWRSFPSGHSSFSFAGLGFLSMFLASQTAVLQPRASLVAVLLAVSPLIGAGLVAASRLEDYRHDVFDVIAGSVLGFTVALFNWRRYYPSLFSNDCSEVCESSNKGQAPNSNAFRRVRDEEEAAVDDAFDIGDEPDARR